MKVNYLYDGCIKISLEKYEVKVLERYVKVLKNSEVPSVESLLGVLMQQQIDFIMDSLCSEATIKVDDLVCKYSKWQRFCKWVGRL
ncbi:hypothetical protein KAR91_38385 [Candidatus Pacearchaeota archaeon]|nr:hypothetical protein [Candidatus Pacearchaeota archaeon]